MATPQGEAKRDKAGRFLPGHTMGRPKGMTRREWREALNDAVTRDEFIAAVKALCTAAAGGDVSAIRLLLEHTVGKPRESVDITTGDHPIDITIRADFSRHMNGDTPQVSE